MDQQPHLALNLNGIQVPYHAALQHALDVLAVSTLAVENVAEQDYLTFGVGLVRVGPAPALKLPFKNAQEEARRWHLKNAFRDAIDFTGLFLDGVRDVATIAREAAAGTLTVGTFKEITTSGAESFRKLGIAKKVQLLREELHLELYFYEHVFSVNRIRNCLVHRAGVVAPIDVEADGALKFTYRALELFSPNFEGTGEIILEEPGVPVPGPISLRAVDKTRSFKVGDRIVLTPEEVQHVFMMLMQFSITTIEELRGLVASVAQPAPQTAPPTAPSESGAPQT